MLPLVFYASLPTAINLYFDFLFQHPRTQILLERLSSSSGIRWVSVIGSHLATRQTSQSHFRVFICSPMCGLAIKCSIYVFQGEWW